MAFLIMSFNLGFILFQSFPEMTTSEFFKVTLSSTNPISFETARAVSSKSPVIMKTVIPATLAWAILSLTFSLTGSLMQTSPKKVVFSSIYLGPSFSLK